MTEDQASAASYRLQAFRSLVLNPAWVDEVAPMIAKARNDALDGCTARNKTPAQRAEHVEAYHLAEELLSFCQNRIESTAKELRQYQPADRPGDL